MREAEQAPEGAPRASSPIPWVMAGTTVIVLLVSYALDQWATARVEMKHRDTTLTLAAHFGRDGVTPAAETDGRAVTTARAYQSYDAIHEERGDQKALDSKSMGRLLMILLFAACAIRLAMAFVVQRAGHARGPILGAWAAGTAACLGVFVVALMFNSSGLPGGDVKSNLGMLGEDARIGWGVSTWGALGALLIDAFSILAVKAAMTPRVRRAPAGRRRRR